MYDVIPGFFFLQASSCVTERLNATATLPRLATPPTPKRLMQQSDGRCVCDENSSFTFCL